MNTRNRRLFLALAILSLALTASVGTAPGAPGASDPAVAKQLAAVRQATAGCHDSAAAFACRRTDDPTIRATR